MKHINFRTWVLILLALLIALSGFAVGKYFKTISQDYTIEFTAELAKEFYLKEHVAIRQDDGTYELSDTNYVPVNEKQEYILIPGLDIPKDPHIVINGKSTNIPAYLFLEVVDNTIVDQSNNKLLTYNFESCWIPAQNLKTPQHGGTVYVFCDSEKNPMEITENYIGNNTINILKEETVTVSQKLLSGVNTGSLTFYAYLEEASLYKNP